MPSTIHEDRRQERARLQAEALRRVAAGESWRRVAASLKISGSTLRQWIAKARAAGEYVYHRPRDRGLVNALAKCPKCGRLKILPCSACDPNQ
jgi:DNA invertase Pin-like site-specific DNA recombinase